MCMPMAGLALGLLSGIVSYMGQMQQYKHAVAAHEQTVLNARAEASDQYAAKQFEIRQEQAAAAEKKLENQIEGKTVVAEQEVASGEAGVMGAGGYTVQQLLAGNYAAMGRDANTIDRNYAWAQGRLRHEMDQVEKQTQHTMNQSYSSLPPKPSPLSIFSSISLG